MSTTYLIDEQHTRHKLCDALVDILVYHLVNLATQLVGDLSLPWLHELTHHAHDILATLRSRIGDIEIVKRDILYHILLLVHITLRHWHVFLSLQVELRGKSVTPSDTLDCASVCFDVDDISDTDALLLDRLVDRWI